MHLIVGLGNPGSQYDLTRHNVGFMFLDAIAEQSRLSFSQTKFQSLYAKGSWRGHEVVLLKPQTYMNLSGGPVVEAMTFFKLLPSQLVVVFDDLDQEFGAVRCRVGGGHGGHNGIRDILAKYADDKFHRVKIGIGKPVHKSATADWVLSKFTQIMLDDLYDNTFPVAMERVVALLK